MKLTNAQIYESANNLIQSFQDESQRLPVRLNFRIQKNKQILISAAQEIEAARVDILNHWGKMAADGSFSFLKEEDAQRAADELKDLLKIEQDLNILTIQEDDLSEELSLTIAQMEAILFMIKED